MWVKIKGTTLVNLNSCMSIEILPDRDTTSHTMCWIIIAKFDNATFTINSFESMQKAKNGLKKIEKQLEKEGLLWNQN